MKRRRCNAPPKSMASFFKIRTISVGILLALSCIALFQCGGDDQGFVPQSEKAWIMETDLLADPSLSAVNDQIAILELSSGSPSDQLEEHSIPYVADEASETIFGLDPDDPYITRVEVRGGHGETLAVIDRGGPDKRISLPQGDYSIIAYHDPSAVPPEGTVAFIHPIPIGDEAKAGANGQKTVSEGSTIPLYPTQVALVTDGPEGNRFLMASPVTLQQPAGDWTFHLLSAQAAVPEPPDENGAFRHWFAFRSTGDSGDYYLQPEPYAREGRCPSFNVINCQDAPDFCPPSQVPRSDGFVWSMAYFAADCNPDLSVSLNDQGTDGFSISSYTWTDPESPWYVAENGYIYFTAYAKGNPPAVFRVLPGALFYDNAPVPIPGRGEVALYSGNNYTGRGVLLSASFSDARPVMLDVVRSIKYGFETDTTVAFFSGANFEGSERNVGFDTPVLNSPPGWTQVGSIKVFDSRKVLISSKKCRNCNLAGVNLSGLNLDDVDVSGANFVDSNLDNTRLQKANFDHASLSGATLENSNCEDASFSEANLMDSNLENSNCKGASFTGANLMDSNLDSTRLQKANFGHATLSGANLNYSNCEGASFTKASLQGYQSASAAATLSGAFLKNASFAYADISGADFSNASLFSDSPGECSPGGDGFTTNCASAAGATINETDFSGAYLSGTDFSSSNAISANFQNAIVDGALFKNANLNNDIDVTNRTNFSGALLRGADFTGATVSKALFDNAVVDLQNPQGACVVYKLQGHTDFAGYWKTPGDRPCVMFAYDKSTTVPETDNSNRCPDNKSGPCSPQQWSSPLYPPTTPTSFCFIQDPVCDPSQSDPNW
jgi:uncharacterized protein YjbI with pentapeptide repeats